MVVATVVGIATTGDTGGSSQGEWGSQLWIEIVETRAVYPGSPPRRIKNYVLLE
jgi:hypothetical protein